MCHTRWAMQLPDRTGLVGAAQSSRYVTPMMGKCWPNVADVGPAFGQRVDCMCILWGVFMLEHCIQSAESLSLIRWHETLNLCWFNVGPSYQGQPMCRFTIGIKFPASVRACIVWAGKVENTRLHTWIDLSRLIYGVYILTSKVTSVAVFSFSVWHPKKI